MARHVYTPEEARVKLAALIKELELSELIELIFPNESIFHAAPPPPRLNKRTVCKICDSPLDGRHPTWCKKCVTESRKKYARIVSLE